MDDDIPIIVRMRVECAKCGHSEDETFEFDMPFAKSQPMEAYEPGKCPECGGPVQMRLKRTQRVRLNRPTFRWPQCHYMREKYGLRNRAKKRPCLVLGTSAPVVDQDLIRGMPKVSTAPTVLVAPYYGASRTSTRAGYKQEFVDRVRHCEYRQFFWDFLPFTGGEESILRLDQLQPIGAHHDSYVLTDYRLSSVGIEFMDGMLSWLIWGVVKDDSLVALYRDLIEQTFPP